MCVVPSLCWPFPTVLSIPPMLQPSFASPCFSDVCMASWEAVWAFRRAFGTGMHGVVCLCAHGKECNICFDQVVVQLELCTVLVR